MKIGVTIHATDRTIAVHELAVAAEERGFHSLYVPEHTHIPVSRETPPPTGGDELEEKYLRTPDPIVSLAAAAAVTSRILLGTAVTLPAQHDPIAGPRRWPPSTRSPAAAWCSASASAGTWRDAVPRRRLRRATGDRARAHAPQPGALRDDVASFEGERVTLAPSWSWPKPVQRPRVRTLLGGERGQAVRRRRRVGRRLDPSAAVASRSRCRGSGPPSPAGRDPDALHIVPMGVLPTEEKLAYFETSRGHRDGAAAARRRQRLVLSTSTSSRRSCSAQAGSTDSHVASARNDGSRPIAACTATPSAKVAPPGRGRPLGRGSGRA